MRTSILFSKKHVINIPDYNMIYDNIKQINFVIFDGKTIPYYHELKRRPTQTKTMALPGDDDADPNVELLY